MENLVIVGSGPAGCTAAIYAARASLKPVLLAGGLPGGLLTRTSAVENFPGFPEGIQGFDLMENMRAQAERFGAAFRFGEVKEAELGVRGEGGGVRQRLVLGDGSVLESRAVIVAAGSRPRELGCPGEQALKARGVSYCATCDGAFWRNVPVCVIGGGDSALEEALFLTRFASEVHLVHRRDAFRASSVLGGRVLANGRIVVHWNSVVEEMLADGRGMLRGVRLRDVATGASGEIACSAAFVAIGHIPDTEVFAPALDMLDGYIVCGGGRFSTATSAEGVFAAGDCVDRVYRQAVTAAASGCRAALDAQRWLAAAEAG